MKASFPHPSRVTRVRSYPNRNLFRSAIARARASIVLDNGSGFAQPDAFALPGGESDKRWAELERILSWLAENKKDRSSPLVVIGGGAVLDLGAFAASLYRRGMPLILVPTTLLAMVDATLGGKTAVDLLCEGRLQKNFAGTFYPATEVWLLLDFLETLPLRERVSGAGEVFKTLWIRGGFWNSKALHLFVRTGKVSTELGKVVKACLETKARIVAADPLDERRIREVLNFGHTVGHALESASGLSHGECVLWGMAVETTLLGSRGHAMEKECRATLLQLGLAVPPEFTRVREKEWKRLLGADKKAKGAKIEMSLLAAPGKVVKKKFTADEIAGAIRAFRA